MLFAVAVGVPAGVMAAARRGSFYDQTLMGAALTGYSMPIFWWGLLLILLFSVPQAGSHSSLWPTGCQQVLHSEPTTGFLLIDSSC